MNDNLSLIAAISHFIFKNRKEEKERGPLSLEQYF